MPDPHFRRSVGSKVPRRHRGAPPALSKDRGSGHPNGPTTLARQMSPFPAVDGEERAPTVLASAGEGDDGRPDKDCCLPRVTVLMTSFNRRARTLACLRSLLGGKRHAALRVILVDDSSTDGTAGAVRVAFPDVAVVEGSGDLYWAGGMRVALERAWEQPFDYLLWLNDDVVLAPDALANLIRTERELRPLRGTCIVAGALRDPITGVTTYSGVARRGLRRTEFHQIPPGVAPRRADTMNGNVVLVPRHVAQRLGTFDPAYRHGIADYDYGLRAAAAGIETWVAPGYAGACSRNASPTSKEGLRAIMSPKRLPPRAWLVFTRRHTGTMWAVYWASPYARALLQRRKAAGSLLSTVKCRRRVRRTPPPPDAGPRRDR
jgi:GT2 family glycosyltransferase